MTGVGYVTFLVWVCLVDLLDIWLPVILCIVSSLLSASSVGGVRPNLSCYGGYFLLTNLGLAQRVFLPVYGFISPFLFALASGCHFSIKVSEVTAFPHLVEMFN